MMKSLLVFFALLCGFPCFAQLYQVPVYTVTSLKQAQPGGEVSNAIDDNDTSIYHSRWQQVGIPDELQFYFTTQVSSIKKIIYTPRQLGSNGIWTNVSVYYSTQSSPNSFILISDSLSWQADNDDKVIELPNSIQKPYEVKFVVNEGVEDLSTCAEMRFYSETAAPIISGIDCDFPTATLSVSGANDIKATILAGGSTASSFEPGEDISGSFDNDLNTLYHSSYGNTVLPVVLNYRLDGLTKIDYLRYIPRSDGGSNGNFGNVSISYNTLADTIFKNLMDFNFDQSGLPVAVHFPIPITPLNVRLTVANGVGDFVSCAEMEFYTSGSADSTILFGNIFSNELYSALYPTVSQMDIDTISSPFYQALAQCIFDGSYVSRYRVQSFEVYQTLSSIERTLKIGQYDIFENSTGIAFPPGEKIALFARNIPSSTTVYLTVKDFSTQLNGPVSYYALHNGLNVFDGANSGLGYINYFNNDTSLLDVEINIASGKINGYFDRETSTNAEWPDLLVGTAYPVIDIRGKYAHLVQEKAALRGGSPFDAQKLIGKYDTIIQHERMLMGLFKYNKSPKNRQLAYGSHGGGYYAGGLGVNLDLDWGEENLVDPERLDLWGIPHEFGHINQIRPDLYWIGTTEVTNNIYSVWVQYNMNPAHVPYARLEAEREAPTAGMAAIEGGRINGTIYNTHIKGEPIQGSSDYDVFKVLVPFWQLELYYQLAGAARDAPVLSFDYPTDYTGVDYAHWYGIVAETSRNSNSEGLTDGELLLNFVKNTCDAVQEDLTTFFQETGFLKPVDVEIDDYGIGQLTITQAQVDAAIAYIKSKNYDTPVSPVMNYISAHSVNMFKNRLPLSGETGLGVSLKNNYLTVQHSDWKNAVAYETYDTSGSLLFVSISGTGDLSNQTTTVYYPSAAKEVYAVGFDGKKILVYPVRSVSVDNQMANSALIVYPNPVSQSTPIHLVIKNDVDHYIAQIIRSDGQVVFYSSGTIQDIETLINKHLVIYPTGNYLLYLKDIVGREFRVKFIKI